VSEAVNVTAGVVVTAFQTVPFQVHALPSTVKLSPTTGLFGKSAAMLIL
jgi:hypothetical protein